MSTLEYEAKVRPAAVLKYDAKWATGMALFARYGVIGADGDVTSGGFLPHGAVVPMLVGHEWRETPSAKAKYAWSGMPRISILPLRTNAPVRPGRS